MVPPVGRAGRGRGAPPLGRSAPWVLAALLAACAVSPLDTTGVDPTLTPRDVLTEMSYARGRTAEWGGVLVSVTNLPESTDLEVLAYPLDRTGRPRPSGEPLGRFVARQGGYLDPAVYARGRWVTAVGTVAETLEGKVGEAPYTYPLLEVRQVHLWPPFGYPEEPRIQFGIGVIFH